jgi:hypothetical protein
MTATRISIELAGTPAQITAAVIFLLAAFTALPAHDAYWWGVRRTRHAVILEDQERELAERPMWLAGPADAGGPDDDEGDGGIRVGAAR